MDEITIPPKTYGATLEKALEGLHRRKVFWLTFLGFSVAFFGLGVLSIRDRGSGSDWGSVIGSLKSLSASQALFKEGDKDGDGKLDYATSLAELGPSGAWLIDNVLESGKKGGYSFKLYSKSDGRVAGRLKQAGLARAQLLGRPVPPGFRVWTRSSLSQAGWYVIAVPIIPEAGYRSYAVDESGVIVSGPAPPIPGAWKYELSEGFKAYAPVAVWSLVFGVLFTFALYLVFSVFFSILRFMFRPHLARVTPKPAA